MSNEPVLERVARLARGEDARLAHQALLSLGAAHTASSDRLLVALATSDVSTQRRRSAILSGIHGRELPFLTVVLSTQRWDQARTGRYEFLRSLARCIVKEGRSDRIGVLLTLIATALNGSAWHGGALVEGTLAGRPRGPRGELAAISMPAQPDALAALASVGPGPGASKIEELVNSITWPGGPNSSGEEVRPMTAEERARFERGRVLFADVCSTCHQTSGLGEEGKAPPLRNSPWLLGSAKRPIRILLGGLVGPIEVAGREWNLEMPVYAESPEHVAAVLTYVRREWGHGADPITPEQVSEVMQEMQARSRPWTADELAEAGE